MHVHYSLMPISLNKLAGFISLDNISKIYSNKTIFENLKLDIVKGEFVCIYGPNGCGKTTLLNIIAGVIQPDSGKAIINSAEPSKAIRGYVFQNYRDSLLPWRTNFRNIAFPLELQGIKQAEALYRINSFIKEFGFNIPLHNFPYQCSGGEQQLVALVRELVAKPDVLIMDEPFSALSQKIRSFFRIKIQEIWQKLGLTIIFVTHDVNEAIQVGDRIFLMQPGKGITTIIRNELPRIRDESLPESHDFKIIHDTIEQHYSQFSNLKSANDNSIFTALADTDSD